ncbi:hypothetical protein NKG94_26975 [Micromonospora sp. M12]
MNAHGTGTPVNDAVEAASFAQLFPDADRPVLFATKGAFGHTSGRPVRSRRSPWSRRCGTARFRRCTAWTAPRPG